MQLSVTTDYFTATGNPGPYLERIARAGFTHIHWCHQWNTDFIYSRFEIAQIKEWLREYGLQLLDLHASHGQEKAWASTVPSRPRRYPVAICSAIAGVTTNPDECIPKGRMMLASTSSMKGIPVTLERE